MTPIKFKPIYKGRIWGGDKFKTLLNRNLEISYGESWEISAMKGNISETIDNNNLIDLIKEYKGNLLGEEVYKKYKEEFPLLIKFLDASDDLSIQVHPNDEKAKPYNSLGKTEMWYIVDCEPNSYIYAGFKDRVDLEICKQKLQEGKILDIINKIPVKKGDMFFIPAGLVHGIGKGNLIAEIQQTSDITYRFYDFDRVDKNGNKRELHIDKALDCIDFNIKEKDFCVKDDVICDYFNTKKISLNNESIKYRDLDSFKILMFVEGNFKIDNQEYKKGDTIFLPKSIENTEVFGKGIFLEIK